MKRIISLTLALLLVVSCLFGCSLGEKTMSVDGLTITVPGYFQDYSTEDFAEGKDFVYGFGSMAVMGLSEEISGLSDYMEEATVEEYGELMIELNEMDCELTRKDDVWTFVYDADVDGTSYTYLSAVYASETHFWTVQAYCATSDYAKNYDTMWAMLKSVIV